MKIIEMKEIIVDVEKDENVEPGYTCPSCKEHFSVCTCQKK